MKRLADDPALIIPGHDPAVMSLFQAPSPELEGIAVRLDA
jgi:glyoxylase-like metal-dependent hydrolase (beta-lactamase superfamily II)